MLKKLLMAAFCIFAVRLSFAEARAKTPAEIAGDLVRHVKVGTSITVTSYDEKLRAFGLSINSETAVGPNFAEPEELRAGLDFEEDALSMMRNKEKIIGAVYQVKKPLRLMTENEVLTKKVRK